MAKVGEINSQKIKTLKIKSERRIKGKNFLEQSAQKFISTIYDELKETIVLLRLFVTVPFGNLPTANKNFVNALAKSNNIQDLINDNTLVLSLVGTRGLEKSWNDRRNSQGHIGIPLASADFIGAIPMMSRLLKQLGLDLEWIASGDTELVKKTLQGGLSGVFYVQNARTEVDKQGRKIIAGQDFVKKYKIRSVFGIGGGYLLTQTFLTVIFFLKEEIDISQAEMFMPLINMFKSNTGALGRSGRIFES